MAAFDCGDETGRGVSSTRYVAFNPTPYTPVVNIGVKVFNLNLSVRTCPRNLDFVLPVQQGRLRQCSRHDRGWSVRGPHASD